MGRTSRIAMNQWLLRCLSCHISDQRGIMTAAQNECGPMMSGRERQPVDCWQRRRGTGAGHLGLGTAVRNTLRCTMKGRGMFKSTTVDNHISPKDSYYVPILQALYEAGGGGRTCDILDRVEEIMADELTDADHETISKNQSPEPRWKNNAHWARDKMIKDGLLLPKMKHGYWEISEAGRRYLRERGS